MTSILPPAKQKRLSFVSTLSACIGIFLLLLALQLHSDWRQLQTGDEGYLVLNKPVNLLNTLGFSGGGFSEAELKELNALPAVNRVGGFLSNDFRVSLGSNRLGFRTEAFFESVPDEFVDVDYPGWGSYQAGDIVPIILSADYLALYNFGFAPSQGLPQFSPGSIGLVTMNVDIRGNNGRRGQFRGRIVGFSKRLNSIIVPQAFLRYANKEYGNSASSVPSRLILEVENPRAPELIAYMEDKGYEMNANKAFGEEVGQLVNKGIGLISVIGILVLLLALLVFYLGYRLTVEERISEVRTLFSLGYTPSRVARYFVSRITIPVLLAWILLLIALQGFHFYLAAQIRAMGFDANSILSPITWIVAIIMAILLTLGIRLLVQHTMSEKYI